MKIAFAVLFWVPLFGQINGCYNASTSSSGTITLIPCQVPPPPCYVPATTGLPPLPATLTLPALPQNVPCPTYPTVTSAVNVTSASQLQPALNTAVCGQAIVLQTGLTVTGNTVIPPLKCPANNLAMLISSTDFSAHPSGKRIAQTDPVPWLLTGNGTSALKIANGAAGWYIDGIGISTVTPIPFGVYPIMDMGDNDATTLALLPSNITFDRILITAPNPIPGGNYTQRGASLNCIGCSFINSQCWNIVNVGMDTQCLEIDNTPGPLRIENNYLEAAGENIMTNTKCTPTTCAGPNNQPNGVVPAPIPSDILIVRNNFAKQVSWAAQPAGCTPSKYNCYTVKDEFEVKHGQRIWVADNVFENTFNAAQGEFIIINTFAAGPYVSNDLTFTNNLFRRGPSVIPIAGNGTTQTAQRILFRNNLALNILGTYTQAGMPPGRGSFFQSQNTGNLTFDHNTIINQPPTFLIGAYFSDAPPSTNINFTHTNNIMYGPFGANANNAGGTVAALPASTLLLNSALVGDWWNNNYPASPGTPASYASPVYPPSDNLYVPRSTAVPVTGQPGCMYNNKPIAACWPLDWATVGMVDWAGASAGTNPAGAALAPNGPFSGKGSDGADIGANVSAVLQAVAGLY